MIKRGENVKISLKREGIKANQAFVTRQDLSDIFPTKLLSSVNIMLISIVTIRSRVISRCFSTLHEQGLHDVMHKV